MEIFSDEQLILDYRKGKKEALEILIRRYLKPIFNFVYRFIGNSHDAEDATQEVFVKVWHGLKKFKHHKKFKTWIFSIAKNTSIDFLRRKRKQLFIEFKDEEDENAFLETLVDPSPIPNELFEQANIKERLNSAIQKLKPKSRMILFLRYNEHLTFREIAEIFGEPLNTIKSRHQRAIIQLKRLLG